MRKPTTNRIDAELAATNDVFRLDDRTLEAGRRGLATARATLARAAGERHAAA